MAEEETQKEEAVTSKKVVKEVKKILNELVTESEEEYILLIGALSKNGLLPSYYKEQKDMSLGLNPEGVMTDKEFNKMINDYKQMEV